ncbi:MAG: tetratricopeptide repeat protein [Chloroflexota bacterium]
MRNFYVEARIKHKFAEARRYLQEVLEIYEKVQHLEGIADVYYELARLEYQQGDLTAAHRWVDKCLQMGQQLNSPDSLRILSALSQFYAHAEEYVQAQYYLEKSIALSRQLGVKGGEKWGNAQLALIYVKTNSLNQAKVLLVKNYQTFFQTGDVVGIVFTFEVIAALAVLQKQLTQAAQLITWSDKMRQDVGDMRPNIEQADIDQYVATIRAALGDEAYLAACSFGQQMTTEEATTLALGICNDHVPSYQAVFPTSTG